MKILIDNASTHTAKLTKNFLAVEVLELLPHPPYLPDLAPCGFGYSPSLNSTFKAKDFNTLQALGTGLYQYFKSIPEEEYRNVFTTIENHLKSSDQTIRVKSDRDKRFRTQKNLIAPSISLPDDYSQISHNSSLKIKSSSKKSSENVKCCTPNESSRKGTSILDLTERITSDATSIIQPIPNSINLSKISNSDAVLKQILVPHNLFHNVEVVENISEVKTSANQFIDSSSELSIVHDKLSLNSNLKRKHNRKYCEVVGKKLRKSDDCNLPRRDTSQHKDRRSVIKNEMRSSSNLNSKSDSPLNVIKDGLEIYDSLSDIDQVTLLEEDLYSHNFVNFANGTHLLHIDWAGLNFNTSIHFQPQTIAHHSLISQVGLSYSLLGEDTFVQCVKNLFNQKPNPQILSCIRQLGFGAFIEDIIHLEKDRIEIELDCCKHYGYIKCRDIYLRRIISGYRGILNSSSDSLSGANYNSPCVTTELFNSALHIYHRSTSSTK
ncbi:Histone-lysine N-methyltransferase SETMAR-like [Oopsacas minuta]|uniref:Histone-lysine N-methyltransferase SETMAR-like n=1 Tax=Oopsacas minuta TaxID=111878 RepID=A0AAV7JJZ7_9METZ|nr:Histone-lysine N-methyltransferase SETMAR-like [Oopsacas minuta]